nr:hypothetical protein [Ramlibacter montanisoli]
MPMASSAQQQHRDLGAREPQHAQAGQLPGPFGQRDARVVVDDADGDHRREQGEDRAHDPHVAGADLLHVAQHRRLAERARHARQPLRGLQHTGQVAAAHAQAEEIGHVAVAQRPVQRIALHEGVQAHHVADGRLHPHLDEAALALAQFHGHAVARLQAQFLGQAVGHQQPVGRRERRLPLRIDHALQPGHRGMAVDQALLAARAVDEAHGQPAAGFHLHHAGQAREFAAGGGIDLVRHPDDHVRSHAQVELRVDDGVDGVAEEIAHDHDCHRGRDAAHRER